ncbi:hypothetical protein [Limnobacter thiooxidans]|uniref:hypothetical protein n=1 Tax=Limnobacter thiooxidans TaxID=131080 RepID=UPI00102DCBFA
MSRHSALAGYSAACYCSLRVSHHPALAGSNPLLIAGSGHAKRQGRIRIASCGIAPRLRIKREAHLNRQNDRNTAQ